MMQQAIVIMVIAIAAGYAVWRVYKVLAEKDQPCCGCEGCALKNQGCNKKTCEKFGQSK